LKKIVLTDDLAGPSSDDTIRIDSKEILQFSKDEDSVFSSVVEFMNRLPSQVVDGRPVKEWLRLRNHSLWWFAHNSLWRHIEANIGFIINFENMLDAIRPDAVDMQGFYDRADLIQQICRKKNVRLSTGFSFRNKVLLQSIKNKGAKKGSEIIAGQKRSRRIALAREAGHENTDSIRKGCVIHVAHETYRRRTYDFETGEIREGEYIAQKILQQVKGKGVDLLGIDVDHTSKGEFRALQQRLNDKDQYWLPFEIFEAQKYGDRELEKTVEQVKRALVTLFKNKNFQVLFSFNGISLWDTLSVRFDLLSERLPQRIRSIEAAKDILQKLEPRSVFLLYEKGPSAMTFIIAADELGVKTVGMQHGIIHERHPDYAITDLRSDRSVLGSPIPTVTVVFGEFYKKLLTEKLAYPQDRVIVAGNPTYDGAGRYSKQLDRKAILGRLNLDPARKMVLVATSMGQKKHGQPDYDVVMIETLARSFANHDGVQVVIKLHPKEDETVYRKIIEQNGAANFTILDHPVEELILVCDVFLAVATTTILEAIVLEKPVIIFQHANKLNWYASSLLENGAAAGAKNEELADRVMEILDGKALVQRLGAKESEFAKHYFNLPSKEISRKIADVLVGSGNGN
jgi:alpha-2,8-polysialyltransferase (POLYST)